MPPDVPTVLIGWCSPRALHETDGGDGKRNASAAALLREGIEWLPHEVDLYLQLGQLLEASDATAAIELYVNTSASRPRQTARSSRSITLSSPTRRSA